MNFFLTNKKTYLTSSRRKLDIITHNILSGSEIDLFKGNTTYAYTWIHIPMYDNIACNTLNYRCRTNLGNTSSINAHRSLLLTASAAAAVAAQGNTTTYALATQQYKLCASSMGRGGWRWVSGEESTPHRRRRCRSSIAAATATHRPSFHTT